MHPSDFQRRLERLTHKMEKLLLLLATQRCGSTMVCYDLNETNQFGFAQEHFLFVHHTNYDPLEAILDALTIALANGAVATIKVMASDIPLIGKLFRENGLVAHSLSDQEAFLSFFYELLKDKEIYIARIYRKDKAKQAVSRLIAAETNLYHRIEECDGRVTVHKGLIAKEPGVFDVNAHSAQAVATDLARLINEIYGEERYLDVMSSDLNLDIHWINYEDAMESFAYVSDLIDWIDLRTTGALPSRRRTQKLSDSTNEALLRIFEEQPSTVPCQFQRVRLGKNKVMHIPSRDSRVVYAADCFQRQLLIDCCVDRLPAIIQPQISMSFGGVVISRLRIECVELMGSRRRFIAELGKESSSYERLYRNIHGSGSSGFIFKDIFLDADDRELRAYVRTADGRVGRVATIHVEDSRSR